MKTARNPDSIHTPLGRYVHQLEASAESRHLFIPLQSGAEPAGTVPEDAVAPFRVALENVMRNLEAAGFETSDLVKLTTYVVGELDPAGRRAGLDRLLGDHFTTSTLVMVVALASPQYKVE